MVLAVTSFDDEASPTQSRTVRDTVLSALRRTVGVGTIETIGGTAFQLVIETDPGLMQTSGMTIRHIADATEAATRTHPLGSIVVGSVEHPRPIPSPR